MEFPIVRELVVVFGLAVIVLLLSHNLKIPAIVGFLITGVLAGPHALGLVQSPEVIETLAQIGVVLLLFTIGAEFSLGHLLQIRRLVLLGGTLHVTLCITAIYFLVNAFNLEFGEAFFLAILFSLSSTAVVLKMLVDRGEVDTLHGRTTFAILLFQDLMIVPCTVLMPLLAHGGAAAQSYGLIFVKLLLLVVGLMIFRKIVPHFLAFVVKVQNRELFVLAVIVIIFSVAFLTQSVGLSLALGALMAGVIVSESEYSHQALGNIIPFQQIFTTLFFVSIGMLLDFTFLLYHWRELVIVTIALIGLKLVLTLPVTYILGFPLRTGVFTGLALAQVGEFSFVLANLGRSYQLLNQDFYQLFLNVSVITMALTPVLIGQSARIYSWIEKLPWPRAIKEGRYRLDDSKHLVAEAGLKDHLIIIGFGLNGQTVARAVEVANIPYVAIEMNYEKVRHERAAGKHVVYGDATQEAVLIEEGVREARLVVIVIPDMVALRRIVALVRELNPHVYIIVRTRLWSEVKDLYALGANEVVAEQYEVAIEVLSRVLTKELIPHNEIEKLVAEVRSGHYSMIRNSTPEVWKLHDLKLHFPELELLTLRVEENAALVGKRLDEIPFRKMYATTLLAVKRAGTVFVSPGADFIFGAGDIAILLNGSADFGELEKLFG